MQRAASVIARDPSLPASRDIAAQSDITVNKRILSLARKKGFRVFRSSAGLGLQACRDFKKNERIIEYTGRRIRHETADENPNRYLFELDDKWMIDGSPRTNVARYINHSCDPNAEADHDEKANRMFIQAIKTIKAGDEITYDYGSEHFDSYIKPRGCKCAKCLGKRRKKTGRRAG